MFKFLFIMFFFFLLLLFLMGFSIFRSFMKFFFGSSNNSGKGKRSASSGKKNASYQSDNSARNGKEAASHSRQRKKIFTQDDGEYVDYEEVK